MNYRDFLQRVIYVIINPIIQAMVKVGITPNMVTTIGFVGNLAATSLFVVAALMVRSGDMAGQRIFPVGMMVKSACSYHAY